MDEKRKIIVSCTTTKNRIDLLFYMIESLKKQTLMPDVLCINVSSEPYLLDDGITELPDWLNQDFIKVNWVKNTGPYRKLLPIIQEVNKDDFIITSDDDILYSPNWLKSLVELADKYPNHIVCARARDIKKNIFGNWQSYYNWDRILHTEKGGLILPTGGGGVVYRKPLIDLEFLLDPVFQKLAPTTDDLWFRMASMRKNIPVYVCPEIDRENVYLKHDKGLEQINFNKKKNSYKKIFKNRNKKSNPIKKIKAWMGINNTKNDRAWAVINEYSRCLS